MAKALKSTGASGWFGEKTRQVFLRQSIFKCLVMNVIPMDTSLSRFLTHMLSAVTAYLSKLGPVGPECIGVSDDRPCLSTSVPG